MSSVIQFVRFIVFCIFFAIGISAVALSFLTHQSRGELTNYFKSCAALDKTVKDNEKMQNLISQYQDQIALIEREPNVLKRLQDVALGRLPEREDVVYPSDYNPHLTAVAKQVLEDDQPIDPNAYIPAWTQRCSQPKMQSTLFLSGAGLTLITFMLFGGPAKTHLK